MFLDVCCRACLYYTASVCVLTLWKSHLSFTNLSAMTILVDLVFTVFYICFILLKAQNQDVFTFSGSHRLFFYCTWSKETTTVFYLHWLQSSISHSLSTIQYVLVSQVQHQLQAEPQQVSRSGSRRVSGLQPGSSFQLGRGGRTHQTEGPSENEL